MTLKSTGLIDKKTDSQRTKAGILRALIPVVFFLFSAIMNAQNNDAVRSIYISESAMLYNNRIPTSETKVEGVYIAKGTIVYNDLDKAKNNEAKSKNTFPVKKIPQLIAKNTVKENKRTLPHKTTKTVYLPAENTGSFTALSSTAVCGITLQENFPKKKQLVSNGISTEYGSQCTYATFQTSEISETNNTSNNRLYFLSSSKMRPPPVIARNSVA